MADINQLYDALRKADAAGDVESASKLANYIKSQSAGETQTPDNFFSRLNEKSQKRQSRVEQAARLGAEGRLSPAAVGAVSGASDVGYYFGDVPVEIGRSAIESLPQGVKDIASNVGNLVYSGFTAGPLLGPAVRGAGYVLDQAGQGYNKFRQNNPEAGLLTDAAIDVGAGLAWAAPIPKGSNAAISPAKAALDAGASAGGSVVRGATKGTVVTATKAAKLLDYVTTKAAQGISKTVNRDGLPSSLKALPDAELLFVKTLADEGVSIDDALKSLSSAKEMKVTPSVAVTAKIPQMQTQGYLMSRGSAGSKVAADAIEDITKNQIPRMNADLIKVASGGSKSAEQYGQEVFAAAKDAVQKRANILKERAKPYYQASVGVDKSVPVDGAFKKVLENPLAVKALDDYRSDPYTLTNVKSSLADLGVNAAELDKLPYNSTVSLHGARVHLRQLNDAAYRAGEGQKMKAIKKALNDIDEAIEASYPEYKSARTIYSEDAGALKALKDSPIGAMANFSDADFSKIADNLMTKDPQFIKKTIASFQRTGANSQKISDSIAGAFLKRKLEESTKNGVRFGDAVFKNEGSASRLKALVGEEKFVKMEKINNIISDLLVTKNIPSQSITAAAQSVKQGVSLPDGKIGIIDMVRQKLSPSLFEIVQNNPAQAARYNELLFTDEGTKLLEKITKGSETKIQDVDAVGGFLNAINRKDKIPRNL